MGKTSWQGARPTVDLHLRQASDIGTEMLQVEEGAIAAVYDGAAAEHVAEALQAQHATTAAEGLAATATGQNEDAMGTHPLTHPQAVMPAMAISPPPAPVTTHPSRRRAAAQAAAQPAAQPAAPATQADDANAVEVFSVSRERAEAVHASFLDQQAAAAANGGDGSPGASLAAAPLTKGVNRDRAATTRLALEKKGGRITSNFRGVTHHLRTNRWEAHIWADGKQLYLGGFDIEAQAALAYDLAAVRFRGNAAQTNYALENYHNELTHAKKVSRPELVSSLRRQSRGSSQRTTSAFRGVTRHAKGKWEARIGHNPGANRSSSRGRSRYRYLGLYVEEVEAAQAYDKALIAEVGLAAVTNFDLSCYVDLLEPEDREAYVVAKQQADPTYQIPQQVLDARAADKTAQLVRATRLAHRQQLQQLPMLGMGGLDDLVAADMCDDMGHVLAAAAAGGGVGGVAVGVSAYSHMSLDELMAMMQGDDDVHGVVGLWQQDQGCSSNYITDGTPLHQLQLPPLARTITTDSFNSHYDTASLPPLTQLASLPQVPGSGGKISSSGRGLVQLPSLAGSEAGEYAAYAVGLGSTLNPDLLPADGAADGSCELPSGWGGKALPGGRLGNDAWGVGGMGDLPADQRHASVDAGVEMHSGADGDADGSAGQLPMAQLGALPASLGDEQAWASDGMVTAANGNGPVLGLPTGFDSLVPGLCGLPPSHDLAAADCGLVTSQGLPAVAAADGLLAPGLVAEVEQLVEEWGAAAGVGDMQGQLMHAMSAGVAQEVSKSDGLDADEAAGPVGELQQFSLHHAASAPLPTASIRPARPQFARRRQQPQPPHSSAMLCGAMQGNLPYLHPGMLHPGPLNPGPLNPGVLSARQLPQLPPYSTSTPLQQQHHQQQQMQAGRANSSLKRQASGPPVLASSRPVTAPRLDGSLLQQWSVPLATQQQLHDQRQQMELLESRNLQLQQQLAMYEGAAAMSAGPAAGVAAGHGTSPHTHTAPLGYEPAAMMQDPMLQAKFSTHLWQQQQQQMNVQTAGQYANGISALASAASCPAPTQAHDAMTHVLQRRASGQGQLPVAASAAAANAASDPFAQPQFMHQLNHQFLARSMSQPLQHMHQDIAQHKDQQHCNGDGNPASLAYLLHSARPGLAHLPSAANSPQQQLVGGNAAQGLAVQPGRVTAAESAAVSEACAGSSAVASAAAADPRSVGAATCGFAAGGAASGVAGSAAAYASVGTGAAAGTGGLVSLAADAFEVDADEYTDVTSPAARTAAGAFAFSTMGAGPGPASGAVPMADGGHNTAVASASAAAGAEECSYDFWSQVLRSPSATPTAAAVAMSCDMHWSR